MTHFQNFKLLIPVFAFVLMGWAIEAPKAAEDEETIYDAMLEIEELETFTQITTDSEMHRHLHHDGPFTVLAPTDEALDGLPADELADYLQENVAQRELMERHMFQGEHTAEDIAHVLEDGEVVEEHHLENGILLIIDTVVQEIEEEDEEGQ